MNSRCIFVQKVTKTWIIHPSAWNRNSRKSAKKNALKGTNFIGDSSPLARVVALYNSGRNGRPTLRPPKGRQCTYETYATVVGNHGAGPDAGQRGGIFTELPHGWPRRHTLSTGVNASR